MADRPTFLEYVKMAEEEAAAEDAALWNGVATMQTGPANRSLVNSPKFKEIVAILNENPILVAPTLAWLQKIRSSVAMAQLKVLYSDEELQGMMDDLKKEKK